MRAQLLTRVQLFATVWTSPGSSVPEILQVRTLEWVVIFSSRGSSQPRDRTASPVSPALAGGFFTTSATWQAQVHYICH